MRITDKEYGQFDIYLADDGTMDTVIEVCPKSKLVIDKVGTQEIRYSSEFAAGFRDKDGCVLDDGFKELAENALEAYIEQYLYLV